LNSLKLSYSPFVWAQVCFETDQVGVNTAANGLESDRLDLHTILEYSSNLLNDPQCSFPDIRQVFYPVIAVDFLK